MSLLFAGPSRPPANATEVSESEEEEPPRRKRLPLTPKKQTGMILKHSLVMWRDLIW
jgi:hypothetical protein